MRKEEDTDGYPEAGISPTNIIQKEKFIMKKKTILVIALVIMVTGAAVWGVNALAGQKVKVRIFMPIAQNGQMTTGVSS